MCICAFTKKLEGAVKEVESHSGARENILAGPLMEWCLQGESFFLDF